MATQLKSRDPARIERILELLREAWKKHPDLRLCQIISNCAYSTLSEKQRARGREVNAASGPSRRFDPFYVEDDDIARQIELLTAEPPSGRGSAHGPI
jgi:hypothetical protein